MALKGVLALSLDSGMLLACSKRIHQLGLSFDAESPMRTLEREHVPGLSLTRPTASGLHEMPNRANASEDQRLSDAQLDELLGIAPAVLPSGIGTMPEPAEQASFRAVASALIADNSAAEPSTIVSFEPMQFAASLFAIYKNVLENSIKEDAQELHRKTCNNGCTTAVRGPAIRFIKQGNQIWHFIDMQLDAATAVGGRRRVDGAVNVLILAALNAHICDRVVGAVLNGVIEGTAIHLTSDRSPSAFDSRIHDAIGRNIGSFIHQCLSGSGGSLEGPDSTEIVVMSSLDFDAMMKATEDRGGVVENEDKDLLSSDSHYLRESMFPPILGAQAVDVPMPSRSALIANADHNEEGDGSLLRNAEEIHTPTKAPRTRIAPGSAPVLKTKWQSFSNMMSTKSMKSLVKGNIFPDDTITAEESTDASSSIPRSKMPSRLKLASWKYAAIHPGMNCSDDKLREKVALFGHFVLAEGFENHQHMLWCRPNPTGVRNNPKTGLQQFALGNAVGTYAVWAQTSRVHVICLCRARAEQVSASLVWEDILAILEWWLVDNCKYV